MPAKKKPKLKPLKPDKYGDSPLWYAAAENDLKKLRKLLAAGADPNVGDSERITPLYVAAIRGHAEAVELLLRHGADPNLVDCNDTAALQLVTYEGHREVVALLLEHGADPDHRNKWGACPRDFAGHRSPEIKKLFQAIKRRPKNKRGPGRRAPTYAELTGTVDEDYYWTRHARLWDELVPPNGQAKTVQGEVIRVTGKLTREAYRNGNMNWDRDCARLWRFVARTLDDPDTFTPEERTRIKGWVKTIIRDHDDPDVSGEGSPYYLLTEKAVAWVLAHPKPIRHKPDPTITR
jgi:hypothetical protein